MGSALMLETGSMKKMTIPIVKIDKNWILNASMLKTIDKVKSRCCFGSKNIQQLGRARKYRLKMSRRLGVVSIWQSRKSRKTKTNYAREGKRLKRERERETARESKREREQKI